MRTRKGKAKNMKQEITTLPPSQVEMLRAQGYIRAAEVARRLGHSNMTLRNWINDGKVEGRKIGALWYIKWTSILDYYNREDPMAVKLLGLK